MLQAPTQPLEISHVRNAGDKTTGFGLTPKETISYHAVKLRKVQSPHYELMSFSSSHLSDQLASRLMTTRNFRFFQKWFRLPKYSYEMKYKHWKVRKIQWHRRKFYFMLIKIQIKSLNSRTWTRKHLLGHGSRIVENILLPSGKNYSSRKLVRLCNIFSVYRFKNMQSHILYHIKSCWFAGNIFRFFKLLYIFLKDPGILCTSLYYTLIQYKKTIINKIIKIIKWEKIHMNNNFGLAVFSTQVQNDKNTRKKT